MSPFHIVIHILEIGFCFTSLNTDQGADVLFSLRWRIFGSSKDKSHIQSCGGNYVGVSQFDVSKWTI